MAEADNDRAGAHGSEGAMSELLAARGLLPRHRFVVFHREHLPDLIAGNQQLVLDDLPGVPPLAFRVPDSTTFTYAFADGSVEIAEGDRDAATLVELAEPVFSDFVNEIHTAAGLLYADKLSFVRGDLAGLQRWEPALRALFCGRPIWSAESAADLVEPDGSALDLGRSFTLDDGDEPIRAFLEVAGFVHVRGVFDTTEIEDLGEEVDRVRRALKPGEGDAWWSTTHAGDSVVTRINYLDRWSQRILATGHDDRVQRLGRLVDQELRVCDDRLDGPMAFIKNSDVAQGLGDLNWHQDDGLGGHPIMCPLMQVGIQLDHANPANGQLHVLAGSHRYSNHPMSWGEEEGQPVVSLVTEPGDVTIHFGDIFHTTPPPTASDAGRRVLYFKFAPPRVFDVIAAGAHYNDLLFKKNAVGKVAVDAETWAEDDSQDSFQHNNF